MASLIAVVGTLAGSALTFLFGLRTTRRAQQHSRAERLRQELQAACAGFAAALTEMRRCANDRWYRWYESQDGLDQPAAADAFYASRTAAWAAYYQLLLAGASTEVLALAEQAIVTAGEIVHAPDKMQEHARRDSAANLITQFAMAARSSLDAAA